MPADIFLSLLVQCFGTGGSLDSWTCRPQSHILTLTHCRGKLRETEQLQAELSESCRDGRGNETDRLFSCFLSDGNLHMTDNKHVAGVCV